MTECRDWLTSLWQASWKGVPFYFESDDEEGARGLVIHKFPHRDDPYIEDLGEEPRTYSGSAYVHGDDVDAQEHRFKDMLAMRGAGTLVVPLAGPVLVHCLSFKRRHNRDQLGFVAFEVKFIRAAFRGLPFSLELALNIAQGAAAALADVIAAAFAAQVMVTGQPDYVSAAASDGIATAAAALDAVRLARSVEPTASAELRDTISGIVATAPNIVDAGDKADIAALAASLVAATRKLADAMSADTAVEAMADLVDAFAPQETLPALSPATALAYANAAAAYRLARLAALIALSEATIRQTYPSRPDGVSARGMIAQRFEDEIEQLSGAAEAPVFVAMAELRGRVIAYLTYLIADLAPVVTIKAARPLPALCWAWRLYAEPTRDAELIARNQVRNPAFMPMAFQALGR